MRLFYFPNTIAVATALALEEAGQDYEAVYVDFKNGAQQQPDYLGINPKGRVPALEVDGQILTETGALLEFAAPGLVPSDPVKAARVRAVMYYLASTMHVNHAHKMRGHRWADQEDSHNDMAAKVPETMAACAAYVEAECLEGPFVLGDTFTIADAYLYAVCRWLPGDGVSLEDYPNISAFMAAVEQRASFAALLEKGIAT